MRNLLKVITFTAAVGALAMGAGCGKAAAPTCDNAASHAMELMLSSDEMKKASPEEKKMAETMMKGLKDEIIKECKEKKWDDKTIKCVIDAKKMDDMEKCDTKK